MFSMRGIAVLASVQKKYVAIKESKRPLSSTFTTQCCAAIAQLLGSHWGSAKCAEEALTVHSPSMTTAFDFHSNF